MAEQFLCLLILLNIVFAQDNRVPDPNNHFLYPPLPGPQFSNDPAVFASNQNLTFGIIHSEPFKWVTNLTNITITLEQEGNPDVVKRRFLLDCTSNTEFLYWDGQISPIDLSAGGVAYVAAWNCSSDGKIVGTPVFFSHYVNLTAPATSSTIPTTNSTTVPASLLSTTSKGLATVITTTTSSPIPSVATAPSNLQPETLAGALGGGLCGALLAVVAAFFVYRTRSRKRNHHAPTLDRSRHAPPMSTHGSYRAPSELEFHDRSLGRGTAMQKPHACSVPVELASASPKV